MIVELNEQNLQQTIIDGSKNNCVIIFAYDGEDPKMTSLEALLNEKFSSVSCNVTLAKANLRAYPALAQMLPIRALPTFLAVENGAIKDMVEGPKAENPEAFLAPYLPQADQALYNDALNFFNEKNYTSALSKLDEAIAIKNKALYRVTKADIYIRQNNLPAADEIIKNVTMEEQLDVGDYYKSVVSAYALAEKAVAESPIEDLKNKVAEDPENLDLRIDLALQFNQLNQKTEALDQLYYILKKDLNYKDVKKTYLEIIETLGADSAASRYRKKLYTLMY